MSAFKWRQFTGEVILWAVRWYCRYGISYRELAEMLAERGVEVDHTTLYRWVQRYAPELEKRTAWYRSRLCCDWQAGAGLVGALGAALNQSRGAIATDAVAAVMTARTTPEPERSPTTPRPS